MKQISKEEFFDALNKSKYGKDYLELVNNPANHLSKKERGEKHHIHPKSLGGDLNAPENIVKLSYFNHCYAHVLLAKVVLELDVYWKHEILNALNAISRKQIDLLSNDELLKLEIYNWSELRRIGHLAAGRAAAKKWYAKPEDEKKEINKKRKQANIDFWHNAPKELIAEYGDKIRKSKLIFHQNASEEWKENNRRSHKEAYDSKSEEWKENYKTIHKEAYWNMSDEKRLEAANKIGIKNKKTWDNASDEWKEIRNKHVSEGLTKKYKDNPEQRLITSKSVSSAMQGSIFMTSVEDEHVYQVIPRKQQDFFDRGYYRCISPKNRNPYEEKVA